MDPLTKKKPIVNNAGTHTVLKADPEAIPKAVPEATPIAMTKEPTVPATLPNAAPLTRGKRDPNQGSR